MDEWKNHKIAEIVTSAETFDELVAMCVTFDQAYLVRRNQLETEVLKV